MCKADIQPHGDSQAVDLSVSLGDVRAPRATGVEREREREREKPLTESSQATAG